MKAFIQICISLYFNTNIRFLIGVSFQKGLGAVHGLSEPIGATFNTQHGLTNAVILPWVLKDLQEMELENCGGK